MAWTYTNVPTPDSTVKANYLIAKPIAVYGYQPSFVSISVATSTFNMHTSYSAADSNFADVVRAVQTVASPVIIGTPAAVTSNSIVTFCVDAATFNTGPGLTTSGTYGALKDALAAASGQSASAFTITELQLSANTLA
jgi:hypothetical protein